MLQDISFMTLAAAEAEHATGSNAPNPPVGAVLVKEGRILGIGVHRWIGVDHAEVVAIRQARKQHGPTAARGATLYVTLEPCNHQGRTPPCTEAVLEAGIERVVFGVRDPNPNVNGAGAARLKAAGVEVVEGVAQDLCRRLILPFEKHLKTGLPWLVHKIALRETDDGKLTMIPVKGSKTFTSFESLREAHLERRRSDAILTSVGTVLTDDPQLNVRHLPDHEGKQRFLALISQSGRTAPPAWCERQRGLGFEIVYFKNLREALVGLGKRGVLRVLAEAGPNLSDAIVQEKIWDERLVFIRRRSENDEGYTDEVLREAACSPASSAR
jgi:diaminohydroxyphosphoribosylaminopyrimidine deaminase/5-amino-6-(5-phosphoribosylamino)uracil reductase